jgi:type I restriction enzyme R subunit
VQIELKTLGINPRRAMEQIVDYKNDPGNGYTKHASLLRPALHRQQPHRTYYFANNNARHFAFNAEERFLPDLPVRRRGQQADHHLDDFADRSSPSARSAR